MFIWRRKNGEGGARCDALNAQWLLTCQWHDGNDFVGMNNVCLHSDCPYARTQLHIHCQESHLKHLFSCRILLNRQDRADRQPARTDTVKSSSSSFLFKFQRAKPSQASHSVVAKLRDTEMKVLVLVCLYCVFCVVCIFYFISYIYYINREGLWPKSQWHTHTVRRLWENWGEGGNWRQLCLYQSFSFQDQTRSLPSQCQTPLVSHQFPTFFIFRYFLCATLLAAVLSRWSRRRHQHFSSCQRGITYSVFK